MNYRTRLLVLLAAPLAGCSFTLGPNGVHAVKTRQPTLAEAIVDIAISGTTHEMTPEEAREEALACQSEAGKDLMSADERVRNCVNRNARIADEHHRSL
jgi:hypothetical protein